MQIKLSTSDICKAIEMYMGKMLESSFYESGRYNRDLKVAVDDSITETFNEKVKITVYYNKEEKEK